MIVRSCIRMAAVQALRHSTWAEERVYDSTNVPLQEAVRKAQEPFVVVYTDDDDDDLAGRDMLSAETRRLKLVIEFGIAGAVPATDGGSPVEIPATDDALERAVDMLEYQIITQLFHRPDNAWGEIVKRLAPVIHSSQSTRAGEAERGVRWAARQRIIQVDTIADPTPGVVLQPTHPLSMFIALAEDDEDMMLSNVAEMISAMLSQTNQPAWLQAQAALGLADDEVRGIGIAPLDTEVVPLAGVRTELAREASVENIGERDNTTDPKLLPDPPQVPTESENPV